MRRSGGAKNRKLRVFYLPNSCFLVFMKEEQEALRQTYSVQ